jgi:hypothetical protein
MINTLREFVHKVEDLQSIGELPEAYDVFEDECTEQVREFIYSLADAGSNEPFRSAMHNIGFTRY